MLVPAARAQVLHGGLRHSCAAVRAVSPGKGTLPQAPPPIEAAARSMLWQEAHKGAIPRCGEARARQESPVEGTFEYQHFLQYSPWTLARQGDCISAAAARCEHEHYK
jgi:hypothetical protein